MDWEPNHYKSDTWETTSRKQHYIKPASREEKKKKESRAIHIIMTAPATQLHMAKNETAHFHKHHHISKLHVPLIYLMAHKLTYSNPMLKTVAPTFTIVSFKASTPSAVAKLAPQQAHLFGTFIHNAHEHTS